MPTETLIAFVAMTTFMSFVPGPSVFFVAAQGVWRGPKAGLAAVAGVQLGVFIYFAMTAIGLTQIIAASGTAFLVIKWVGVAYMLWLGLTVLLGTFRTGDAQEMLPTRASANGFRDGAIVALSNPKAVLYFVAILPQFLDPSLPMIRQVLMLGVIAMSIDFIAQSIYALGGAALSRTVTRPEIRKWFERGVGAAFVALAGAAALYRRAS